MEHKLKFSFLELDTGITMSYVEIGNKTGPAMLLIHGATDSYLSFSQMASYLVNAGYHVYIPELRGHGHSDKLNDETYNITLLTNDIHSFINKLNIDNVHIVGHSLGSFIAQELAIEPSCKITSLTLIGTSNKIINNDTLSWLLNGDDEFPGIIKLDGNLPDDFIIDWTNSSNDDPSFIEATYQHAKHLPASTWKNVFLGAEKIDNTERLSKVIIPVQIIWGTDDVFFNIQDQLSFVSALGSNKILFLKKEGLGHNTHWENGMAIEISTDICRFMDWLEGDVSIHAANK